MKKLQKHFYSHLVDLDSLESDLDLLTLSKSEKDELLELAHVHVHQTVMDAILNELNDADKKRFLELMAEGRDEKIWEHLNDKVEKIEDKITIAAQSIKKEMREDIRKIKV
ncbi:MAG: hypothetical protein UU34_C0008G0065 [Candidatus Curtissbacteria bacterium GW2011_GWA1_41_11]|uniref:Uncharacterized protein n=1 Tax=Candidatus Curtissbacteria bacterium GW2011_GWA1_41_11 TaxID=1618409 RepID=A0A0G0UHP4_9BACT|nr:MAG: hypothetical protein UU34_C0008G0065 [Candidatus Curtissbacteria bacterium GW2011_GWA1_41_11]